MKKRFLTSVAPLLVVLGSQVALGQPNYLRVISTHTGTPYNSGVGCWTVTVSVAGFSSPEGISSIGTCGWGGTTFNPIYVLLYPGQTYDVNFTANNCAYGCYICGPWATLSPSGCLPGSSVGSAGGTCSVNLALPVPQSQILFNWDYPDNGVQGLMADGQSCISGSIVGAPGPVSWSFDGPSLGCSLSGTATNVTVCASTNTGTVYVKATLNGGTCYEAPLDLVDCSGGCSTCQGGGGTTVQNGSVEMRIGLGWAMLGNTAGYLEIKESAPTNTLNTPIALKYNFERPAEVEVRTNLAGLYQVRAPQVFVYVTNNIANGYTIDLFHGSDITANPDTGPYPITGLTPYRTVTVQYPSGNTNEVLISDSGDGSTYDFTWQGNGWLLNTDSGLREVLKTTTFSGSTSTDSNIVYVGSSPPVQTTVDTWQAFNGQNRLMSETRGSGTWARTDTNAYYTSGYLQQSVRWDGPWKYIVYDAYNRPTNIFSSFQNQPLTMSQSLCREIVNDYSTNNISGSGDVGSSYFYTPRCSIEYLQGVEVGRKYFVALSGVRKEIQCTTPGAAWNDSGNLVTTYTLFSSGFHVNEPYVISRPDGTGDVFQYGAIGQSTTNIVWTGHLDSTGTNVDDGTETISILSLTGNLLLKTVVDVQSGITTSQETYSYDSLNRLTNTAYLDGTSVGQAYDCCNLTSQRDKDGTTTSFTYDGLKRLVTTTLNGVITSNTYDPAGNILETVRFGTDNSAITTSQATFNDARELTSSTDGLNNTTSYTNYLNAQGQLGKQTTYADNSTRIETYYLDGTLQSVTGTGFFPVRYTNGLVTDGGVQREYRATIKLDASGNDTAECSTNYLDMRGHVYKTVYASASAPAPASVSYFNSLGQLSEQVDPDGVVTLYQYDDKGQLVYTATDMNGNGTIDLSSPDRITANISDVVADNGTDVRRTRRYVWESNGRGASNLVATTETSTNGLQTWNIVWNSGTGATNFSQTVYIPANGYRIMTSTAPDGSYTVTTNIYNRLISVTRRDSGGHQIGQTVYGYDAHGRQNTTTDARNGTTTNFYNNADLVNGTATPPPDGVQASQVTTNYFDNRDRIWKTTQADNTSVTNVYLSNGLLQQTSGSRTYPVGYTYDAQGRLKTMTNWSSFASAAGARLTRWGYDGYRGFLSGKMYDGGAAGPSYTYTAAGRLQTRTWARGVTTTYGYDAAGDLQSVVYSDSTSGITNVFDRQGRKIVVTNGAAVCTLSYNDPSELLSESYSGGPMDGLTIASVYDQFLRRTNLTLNSQSATLYSVAYGYDAASRLLNVGDGTNSATYSYVANSPLISQIVFTNNGTLRMTTTKSYDYLNRLTAMQSTAGSSTVASFSYANNVANQRTSMTNADNSYWVYQYDALGQVTSGKKYWSDGTPVAGQQFTYNFDDIGNRTNAAFGGDQTGANLRTANYTNNTLNQLTGRDVPGYVNILGEATNLAAVYVNNQSTYRKGNYYREELATNNGISALWLGITNLAVFSNSPTADITSTNTGNVFLPQTPEQFSYDADGNLTNDGRWTYTWDAENRLIDMTSQSTAPASSQLKLDFLYDYQGRRIQKLVSTNNGTGYVAEYTNRFAYDSWNLIANLNLQSAILQSFEWGSDLSGSIQGAGGVGGLLDVNDSLTINNQPSSHFVAFDGNENVSALLNAATGATSVNYVYGPFGEVVRTTGPLAKANPFRFSTKYQDNESDIVYYGYRYYNSSSGRWLSRDPAQERGGKNLYGFTGNNPIERIDRNGLNIVDWIEDAVKELAAEAIGYILVDKTTWYTYHYVDCQNGSSRYLVAERQWKKWRKGQITEGIGFYQIPDEELEGPAYYTRIERTYACCASCGLFSRNTTQWQNEVDDPEETVIWSKTLTDPFGADIWVKGQVFDVSQAKRRGRQCKTWVSPASSYDVTKICTTHLGVTHCTFY